MKNKLKLIHAAALAVSLAGVSAQAANWDNDAGDGVWTNALNWDTDAVPTSADHANIQTGDIVTYQDGYTNVINRQAIGTGSILNITGGDLRSSKSGNTVRDFIGGTSGHSYLNQSGGFYNCAHVMRIGSGALGTVNLSGGQCDVSRGGNGITGNGGTSVQIASMGTLNITNSTFWTRTGVEIQGGGVFHVYGGSSPEILLGHSSNQASDGDWFQQSNAVLKVSISTNGVTPIVLENNGADGVPSAKLDAGSILDVGFVDGALETGFWPVLDNAEGTWNNLGMVPAAGVDTNDWGFTISNNVLYVGYGLGWPFGEEVLGPPSSQRTLYWTGAGGDTDSQNPTNWVLDTAAAVTTDWGPYDDDNWRIGDFDVTGVELGTNYVVDYDDGSVNIGHRDLEVGIGAQGTLNFNSGDLTFTSQSGGRQEFGLDPNGDGTLNMNGGNLTLNAVRFGVAYGQGTLNLNGGTFVVQRGYGDIALWLGHGGTSTGTVNVAGGRMFTRSGVKLGDGGAIGIFNVEGSAATAIGIGSEGDIDGEWIQNAGSTLKLRLDAGGVTPISIVNKINSNPTNEVNEANVTFATGSILDVGFTDEFAGGNGSWDVMHWDGELLVSDLAFSAGVDTNTWSFAFVDTDSDTTNDTLRVSATGFGPEVVPNIISYSYDGTTASLTWDSEPAFHYNVLSTFNLVFPTWTTNVAAVPSGGATTSTNVAPLASEEFYKIEAYLE